MSYFAYSALSGNYDCLERRVIPACIDKDAALMKDMISAVSYLCNEGFTGKRSVILLVIVQCGVTKDYELRPFRWYSFFVEQNFWATATASDGLGRISHAATIR